MCYSVTFFRRFFSLDRLILLSTRFFLAVAEGRVGFLFFRVIIVRRMMSARRCRASSLFFSRLRNCCALMTRMPSLVRRRSRSLRRRDLHSSGREDLFISKRRWTALDTLLTFCPPAPWARIGVISTSWSARDNDGVICNVIFY